MAEAKRSRPRKHADPVSLADILEIEPAELSESAGSDTADGGAAAPEVACRHIPSTREFLRMYHAAARAIRWGTQDAPHRCVRCGACGGLPLWACLQCPTFGCWPLVSPAHDGSHLSGHTSETGHALAIETRSGTLHCAVCRVFLWNDRLAAVWACAQHSSSASCPFIDAVVLSEDASAGQKAPFARSCATARGLYNLGSTCYMNSVLQLLVHTPALRRHFLSPRASVRAESLSHAAHGGAAADGCVACELDALFCAVSDGGSAPHAPTRLLSALWRSFPRDLAGYAQQDAHEFLTALRQVLHAAVRRRGAGPCECVVHRVLGGTLQSDVVCVACGNCTSTNDPFLDLSLDLPPARPASGSPARSQAGGVPAVPLAECLAAFVRDERLQLHGGRYACASCGESRGEVRKRMWIHTAPRVLTVHLKRFEHGAAAAKVDTPVATPLVLDLAPYMAPGASRAPYHLYGLVSHVGTLDSGHYTAFVRCAGDTWLHADDGLVTRVSWAGVVSRVASGYMLFYARDADSL